jgi:transposase
MVAIAITRRELTATELRAAAAKSRDAQAARRMLAIALVLEGVDRRTAAETCGMDRQTLRDWVHRFNLQGPEGLHDRWTDGPARKLSAGQMVELAAIVETGPDLEKDGVMRWRRIDLKAVIEERFGIVYTVRSVSRILHDLGFSRMSARPRHPAQDRETVEAFKKISRPYWLPI